MAFFTFNIIIAAKGLGLPSAHIQKHFNETWEGKQNKCLSFRDSVGVLWPTLNTSEVERFIACVEGVERENPYPVIEGSVPMLASLKERSYTIGLCTSNTMAITKQKCALAAKTTPASFVGEAKMLSLELFDYISTPDGNSAGVAKPHSYALEYLFEQSGVLPHRAVFVGDWAPDWYAAKKIPGLLFLAVTSGGFSRQAFINAGVPKNQIIETLAGIRLIG